MVELFWFKKILLLLIFWRGISRTRAVLQPKMERAGDFQALLWA